MKFKQKAFPLRFMAIQKLNKILCHRADGNKRNNKLNFITNMNKNSHIESIQ